MKQLFYIGLIFINALHVYGQVTEPITEQQLESITEKNDDVETEDDTYLQQMQQFL